jgi:hypothetical protein
MHRCLESINVVNGPTVSLLFQKFEKRLRTRSGWF